MEYNRNGLVNNSNNMMFNGGSTFAYILIGITTFILAVATINESDEPVISTILSGVQLGGKEKIGGKKNSGDKEKIGDNEKTDSKTEKPIIQEDPQQNRRNKTKRNSQVHYY